MKAIHISTYINNQKRKEVRGKDTTLLNNNVPPCEIR